MKNRTFIQNYWHYFVIFTVLIGILVTWQYSHSHVERKKFRAKLIFLKKPPTDAAPGGHWSADGTWNNEPLVEKPKITHHHKTETTDPHSEKENTKVTRLEFEVTRLEFEELKQRVEDLTAKLPERKRAAWEQKEFLRHIQKYKQPILALEDYDFVFSYPTQSEIMEKYQSKESLQAFCHRTKKFQSMLLEVSGEIEKRTAFARRMHRNYPDIMKKLKRLVELELPIIHIEE